MLALACAHHASAPRPASEPAQANLPIAREPSNREAALQEGRLAWQAQQYADAVVALQRVIDADPDDDLAANASNLLLDSLNKLQRYDEVAARARLWSTDPRFARLRASHQGDLEEIVHAADRKLADKLERTGDYGDAAVAYRKLYEQHPDADDLLYDAAVAYDQAGLHNEARKNYQELLDKFPSSPLVPRVKQELANP
jgi:tetratricopeptide (TPR) repeat protein